MGQVRLASTQSTGREAQSTTVSKRTPRHNCKKRREDPQLITAEQPRTNSSAEEENLPFREREEGGIEKLEREE